MLPVLAEVIASVAMRAIQSLLPNTPADKLELLRLQIQADAQNSELLKGQMEVNAAEAANTNLFVAGWRPAVGWVCAAAFAWQFLLQPVLIFLVQSTGHQMPPMPQLDFATMSTVLMGMLGLGSLRTYEKVKGV